MKHEIVLTRGDLTLRPLVETPQEPAELDDVLGGPGGDDLRHVVRPGAQLRGKAGASHRTRSPR